MDKPAVPTLAEWAGGTAAFERLTDVFYGKVVQDPLLGPVFAGMPPEHARHVAWLAVNNSQPGAPAPGAKWPMPKWGWGPPGGPYRP